MSRQLPPTLKFIAGVSTDVERAAGTSEINNIIRQRAFIVPYPAVEHRRPVTEALPAKVSANVEKKG